jgi:uncharacterized LabA/DUF88 family protein
MISQNDAEIVFLNRIILRIFWPISGFINHSVSSHPFAITSWCSATQNKIYHYKIFCRYTFSRFCVALPFDPMTTPPCVWVIVDNSNIFIEGKYAVAEAEGIGSNDRRRNELTLPYLRIDYGRLLTTISQGRPLGDSSAIVGSRPPPNDSLWNTFRNMGNQVILFDRDSQNRKKEVNVQLAVYATKLVCQKRGILALVTCDGDFGPVCEIAFEMGWSVEIWSWASAASGRLTSKANITFMDLGRDYKKFTFQISDECPSPSFKTLTLTDGDTIRGISNQQVFDIFCELDLFPCWGWPHGTETELRLYVAQAHISTLKTWLASNMKTVQVMIS